MFNSNLPYDRIYIMQILTLQEAQKHIDAGALTEWREGGFYVQVNNEWAFVVTPGSRLPKEETEENNKTYTVDNKKLLTIALLAALLGGGIGTLGSAAVAKNIMATEKGIEGPQGPAGENGLDGKDGKDGKDGLNGKDGVVTSIANVPGWPSNCNNPSVTPLTVKDGNKSTTYPIIICGEPTEQTITPSPSPTAGG